MAKKDESSLSDEDYIPVAFAQDISEAEFFSSLLEEHGIQARIDEEQDEKEEEELETELGQGIPILVAEEHISEAEAIIDRHNADHEYDEDYDAYDEEEDEFEDLGEFNPDDHD